AADAFAGAFAGVVHVTPGLQNTGINPDVGNVPDERVRHNFERKSGKRLLVRGAPQGRFVVFRIYTFDWWNIYRGRQIVDDSVEQRRDAFVLERGTRKNGNNLEREGRFANRLAHLFQ